MPKEEMTLPPDGEDRYSFKNHTEIQNQNETKGFQDHFYHFKYKFTEIKQKSLTRVCETYTTVFTYQ